MKIRKQESASEISIGWMERCLTKLEREFVKETETLAWTMKHGGGIEHIHMADCLRNMVILYERIAAHREALIHAKGGVTR